MGMDREQTGAVSAAWSTPSSSAILGLVLAPASTWSTYFPSASPLLGLCKRSGLRLLRELGHLRPRTLLSLVSRAALLALEMLAPLWCRLGRHRMLTALRLLLLRFFLFLLMMA